MFSDSEKSALKRRDVFEAKKLHGEYEFYWQVDPHNAKKLGLKVWEFDDGRFYVTQSHHIHAPGQAGPYHSSRGVGSSAEEVLRTGIDNITAYGQGAIEEGHDFSDGWFIPNDDY